MFDAMLAIHSQRKVEWRSGLQADAAGADVTLSERKAGASKSAPESLIIAGRDW